MANNTFKNKIKKNILKSKVSAIYFIFRCRISSLDRTFLRKIVFWLSVMWDTKARHCAV